MRIERISSVTGAGVITGVETGVAAGAALTNGDVVGTPVGTAVSTTPVSGRIVGTVVADGDAEGLIVTAGVGVGADAASTFPPLSFFGNNAITIARTSRKAIALLYCLTFSLSYNLIFF